MEGAFSWIFFRKPEGGLEAEIGGESRKRLFRLETEERLAKKGITKALAGERIKHVWIRTVNGRSKKWRNAPMEQVLHRLCRYLAICARSNGRNSHKFGHATRHGRCGVSACSLHQVQAMKRH
ncbi:hypothetical protein VNO77_08347 [Canavalia gladiata]|uniref:Uncharacterized protein n=1 Tax=Canavalia gladiata TaxID=3824 RepID=A0AAN9QX06_CANGL